MVEERDLKGPLREERQPLLGGAARDRDMTRGVDEVHEIVWVDLAQNFRIGPADGSPYTLGSTTFDGAEENVAAFGYGTLAGHPESGEERFEVRFDPQTGAVSYEIQAFSRPALLLSRLGYPFARRVQRRFAEASARALVAGCA